MNYCICVFPVFPGIFPGSRLFPGQKFPVPGMFWYFPGFKNPNRESCQNQRKSGPKSPKIGLKTEFFITF